MPLYIVHTRSAQRKVFVDCGLWTSAGYGRARVWRTRIMRVSLKASLTLRTPLGEINLPFVANRR